MAVIQYINVMTKSSPRRTKILIAVLVAVVALLLVVVLNPFGSKVDITNSVPYRDGYENASSPVALFPGIPYSCDVQWEAFNDWGGPYSKEWGDAFVAGCEAYQASH